MVQQPEFNFGQSHHKNDPPTSAEAEISHRAKRLTHAAIVLDLVREYPGRTACELWKLLSCFYQEKFGEMQECRRRLTDLHRAKMVRQGEPRICGQRGTRQVTWYAVEQNGETS